MYAAGEKLGSYELGERLGEGGMGVVFRASHLQNGGVAALKTVRLANALFLSSMRREIQRLRRLSHPGVVRVLEDGVYKGLPWYAMELLECDTWETLQQRRSGAGVTEVGNTDVENSRRPLALQLTAADVTRDSGSPHSVSMQIGPPIAKHELHNIIAVCRRLCDVLAYIHGEGIIHRDIKPANVFLRPDGQPVLVDFGLVLSHSGNDGREVLQVEPTLAGTVAYMAPEQISCEQVDARADIFALGCLMYETLTGCLPFPSSLAERVATKFVAPLPPSHFAPCVPKDLDLLVLRMLAADRRQRIGHAWDISAALTPFLPVGSVGAAAVSLPTELNRARAYLYRAAFAGREVPLRELVGYIERLNQGSGACVLVRGESGSGKTRLMTEVMRQASMREVMVVAGECTLIDLSRQPSDGGARAAPLSPLRPLFHTLLDVCRELGASGTQQLLGRHLHVLAPFEPSFTTLPGAELCPEAPPLPSEAAKIRLLDAVAETIVALSQRRPLLLLLDDLQWADELTLDLLSHLRANVLPSARVLILGTRRSEESGTALGSFVASAGVREIELGVLDEQTIGTLVADMLASPELPQALSRYLADRSGGNPFFVSEYLRTIVDEGVLQRDQRGAWWVDELPLERSAAQSGWVARLDKLELPGTLRAVVERRLRTLHGLPATLITAAAILGREVDATLLGILSGLGEIDLADALNEVLRRQILEPAAGGGYRFSHERLRETAYDAIPADQRRALHRRAAVAIEERGARADELLKLASHFTQAEVPDKAREYLRRAGEQALAAGAHPQAVSLLARALQFVDHAGSPAPVEERARLHHLNSLALFGFGDTAGGAWHGEQALALYGVRIPSSTPGMVLMLLRQLFEQIYRISRDEGSPASPASEVRDVAVAETAGRLVINYFAAQISQLRVMTATLLAANLANRAGPRGPRAIPYSVLGCTAGIIGMESLAQRYFARARQDAERRGDKPSRAAAEVMACAMAVGLGRWEEGLRVSESAIRIASEVEDQITREALLLLRGSVELLTARLPTAAQTLDGARRTAERRGARLNHAWAATLFSVHELYAGRPESARQLAISARRDFAEDRGTAAANALAVSATAAFLLGDHETALADAQEGIAVLQRGLVQFQMWIAVDLLPWTLLSLWDSALRQGRDASHIKALRKLALTASGIATTLGRSAPIVIPFALRSDGIAARLDGQPKQAKKKLGQALDRARRLGMLIAEVGILRELAALEPEGSTRRAELAQNADHLAGPIGYKLSSQK